jgi:transketolase
MLPSNLLAKKIRKHSLKLVHLAKASHIASALSIADILAVLYENVLHFDQTNPQFQLRDRFILSKGHACTAVYAVLAEKEFFSKEKLSTYGADYSAFMSHISHQVPGVEFSTGSLGHGLPFGVGKALSAKIRNQSWRTFVLLSDGEMDEGSNWEALMFASHHQLCNLTAIIDYNKLQSLDSIANTLGLEPLIDKLVAFGCCVHEIDGHEHGAIENSLRSTHVKKPTVIVAHTTKGKGVSFMENKVEWHYKNPSDEYLALALAEIEASNA